MILFHPTLAYFYFLLLQIAQVGRLPSCPAPTKSFIFSYDISRIPRLPSFTTLLMLSWKKSAFYLFLDLLISLQERAMFDSFFNIVFIYDISQIKHLDRCRFLTCNPMRAAFSDAVQKSIKFYRFISILPQILILLIGKKYYVSLLVKSMIDKNEYILM